MRIPKVGTGGRYFPEDRKGLFFVSRRIVSVQYSMVVCVVYNKGQSNIIGKNTKTS